MIPMFEIHTRGLTYMLFMCSKPLFYHSYNHSAITQRMACIYLVSLDVKTKLIRVWDVHKSGCYAIVSYGFPLLLPFRLSASGWRMRKVYETIQWTVNAIPGHHHSHSLSLSHFRLSFVISLFARRFLLSLGRTRRKRRKLTIKVSCHISVPNAHNKVFRERILNATLII